MIQGYGPVTQALLGTLLTWGLTALGSAMVIFLHGNQVKFNEINLFFVDFHSSMCELIFFLHRENH